MFFLTLLLLGASAACGWQYGGAVGTLLGLLLSYFYVRLAIFIAGKRAERQHFNKTMKWVSRFSTYSIRRR